MCKEDEGFIYSTWLNHYKHSSKFASRIKFDLYYSKHHSIIERILARKAKVLIAYPLDEPDIIIGWACYEGANDRPLLHFIFVKRAFRQMGVASRLLKGLDLNNLAFTHLTHDGELLLKKYPYFQYDPYAL